MNQTVKIKPNFWKDALWFYPTFMLIMGIGFSIFMWRLTKEDSSWLGLSVIMNLLIQPIFLLLWIDNISNRAIFEEDQLILKGFLHKKKIAYEDISEITFSDIQPANLIYFDRKIQGRKLLPLPIWNYSINLFIDEIKNRTDIKVNGYPDKINKVNFNGKIWFLVMTALTIIGMIVVVWNGADIKV